MVKKCRGCGSEHPNVWERLGIQFGIFLIGIMQRGKRLYRKERVCGASDNTQKKETNRIICRITELHMILKTRSIDSVDLLSLLVGAGQASL